MIDDFGLVINDFVISLGLRDNFFFIPKKGTESIKTHAIAFQILFSSKYKKKNRFFDVLCMNVLRIKSIVSSAHFIGMLEQRAILYLEFLAAVEGFYCAVCENQLNIKCLSKNIIKSTFIIFEPE